MAYKQKINPRTGKFDMVSPGGGGIGQISSEDGSVTVASTTDGVDLSVGLVDEEVNGLEHSFDKLVRDHSLINVISADSSKSFSNGNEANASLIEEDEEYYPIAGQMVEYINNSDGRMHVARYTGNYLIDRNGDTDYWCGATFDILNKCWLINCNVNGAAKQRTARSTSGLFWQITDYEASSTEKRTMICSTSYASLIMSGNSSQEYDYTTDGGDSTWQHLTVSAMGNYRSIKRAYIKISGSVKEVFLFNEKNSVYALDQNKTFTALISNTGLLLSKFGYNVSSSIGLCDESEWFVDANDKNNVFLLWHENLSNTDLPYHITWLREASNTVGWEEIASYSVPTNYYYCLRTIKYYDGKLYCYSGDRTLNTSDSACVLNVDTSAITFGTRYATTIYLIPTSYGLVRVTPASLKVYIDGEEIAMPSGATQGTFYTAVYDGDKNVLLVTGGPQYNKKEGNYAMILNLEKKRIINDDSWEEIALVTEEYEGIVTTKDGKISSLRLDQYLDYDKTTSTLSTKASDRNTEYANYLCTGTDTVAGWCPVALNNIVNNTTKLYSDEACTIEWGTITNHAYNPNNRYDLQVSISGVTHKFTLIESKIPVSLATTKALLGLATKVDPYLKNRVQFVDDAAGSLVTQPATIKFYTGSNLFDIIDDEGNVHEVGYKGFGNDFDDDFDTNKWLGISPEFSIVGQYVTVMTFTHTPAANKNWAFDLEIRGIHSYTSASALVRIYGTDSNSTTVAAPAIFYLNRRIDLQDTSSGRALPNDYNVPRVRAYRVNSTTIAIAVLRNLANEIIYLRKANCYGTTITQIKNGTSYSTSDSYLSAARMDMVMTKPILDLYGYYSELLIDFEESTTVTLTLEDIKHVGRLRVKPNSSSCNIYLPIPTSEDDIIDYAGHRLDITVVPVDSSSRVLLHASPYTIWTSNTTDEVSIVVAVCTGPTWKSIGFRNS